MMKDDLVKKYGLTMSVGNLAEVLHITKGAIHNNICKGNFNIPVYRIGGRVMANTSDVAQAIDDAKLLAR